jgi:hypothetical protein
MTPAIDTLIRQDSSPGASAIAPLVVQLEPAKKSVPSLWTVRALGADAIWTTTILPGTAREITLPATTRDVVVNAVSRTGIESPPARLALSGPSPSPGAPGMR